MTHEETTLNTKKALASSLKRLMREKPLKKITISQIINDCNLNRKTFYYHFSDIYDLVKWTLEQEAIEIVKNFDLLIDYEDAIRFVIKYVRDNSHILNCAYDSIGRDEMKRFFYNDFISLVNNIINEMEDLYDIHITYEFKIFLCEFITEAIAGMLVNAFKNNHNVNENQVINNLSVIINSLPALLKNAPKA